MDTAVTQRTHPLAADAVDALEPSLRRRRRWLAGSAAALAVGSLTLSAAALSLRPVAPPPPVQAAPEVKPISAQAQAVPVSQIRLAFAESGLITRVHVNPGAAVEAGDLLVELDTADLAARLEDARASLESERFELAQASSPDAAEIARVEEDVRQAEARLVGAQARLKKQQDALASKSSDATGDDQSQNADQSSASNGATGDVSGQFSSSQLSGLLNQANGQQQVTEEDVTAARSEVDVAASSVRVAKLRLEEARAPKTTQIQQLELRVKQAESKLAQAERALAGAHLHAPAGGTVTSIAAREGEMATAGTAALTVASLDQLQFETKDLDEISAAGVQPGQTVTITVPALGKRVLTGTVAIIADEPTVSSSGDLNYGVTITLAEPAPGLRWGMSAKVEFPPAG